MLDGVRNSAGMDEKTGTRLGGLGELTAAARTSRTVSSDGWTTSCGMVSNGFSGTVFRPGKAYLWRHGVGVEDT